MEKGILHENFEERPKPKSDSWSNGWIVGIEEEKKLGFRWRGEMGEILKKWILE